MVDKADYFDFENQLSEAFKKAVRRIFCTGEKTHDALCQIFDWFILQAHFLVLIIINELSNLSLVKIGDFQFVDKADFLMIL